MTDPLRPAPLSAFENSLRDLHPLAPSAELETRIAAQLQNHSFAPALNETALRRSRADRFLLATLAAGLVAACISVTLLTLDFANRPASSSASPAAGGELSASPTIADTQRLLAQLQKNPNSAF